MRKSGLMLVIAFLVVPVSGVCRESRDIKIIEKSGIIAGMEDNQTQEQGDIKEFSLASVFITDGLKEAGIYVKRDRKLFKVREGDSLKGYTVRKICKDKVVLVKGNKELVLKTFSGDKERRAIAMAEYTNIERNTKKTTAVKSSGKSASGQVRTIGKNNAFRKNTSGNNKSPVSFIEFLRKLAREKKSRSKSSSTIQNPFIKLLEKK